MNHNPTLKQILLSPVIVFLLLTMSLWIPALEKLHELKEAGRIPFVEGSEI